MKSRAKARLFRRNFRTLRFPQGVGTDSAAGAEYAPLPCGVHKEEVRGMLPAIHAAARWLFQLLHPRRCVLCREPLSIGTGAVLCAGYALKARQDYRCTTPLAVQGADGAAAPLLYTGKAAAAMRRYKFRRETALCRWFAAQSAACLAAHLEDWQPELITYIPVDSTRWWTRGFSQNVPIARAVGRACGLPVRAALGKYPSPGAQSRRSSAGRQRAAKQAFFPLPGAKVRGKRVVLLDDVLTTGATAADAVRALRSAGAEKVFVLAVTRTPLQTEKKRGDFR